MCLVSSGSELEKGMLACLPFISVQHALYPVLYSTAYKSLKRTVISKLSCPLELFMTGHVNGTKSYEMN